MQHVKTTLWTQYKTLLACELRGLAHMLVAAYALRARRHQALKGGFYG